MSDTETQREPTHLVVERAGEIIREIELHGLTVHRLARELQHGPKPFDTIRLASTNAERTSGG